MRTPPIVTLALTVVLAIAVQGRAVVLSAPDVDVSAADSPESGRGLSRKTKNLDAVRPLSLNSVSASPLKNDQPWATGHSAASPIFNMDANIEPPEPPVLLLLGLCSLFLLKRRPERKRRST